MQIKFSEMYAAYPFLSWNWRHSQSTVEQGQARTYCKTHDFKGIDQGVEILYIVLALQYAGFALSRHNTIEKKHGKQSVTR